MAQKNKLFGGRDQPENDDEDVSLPRKVPRLSNNGNGASTSRRQSAGRNENSDISNCNELPICEPSIKRSLLNEIKKNLSLIVIGETGCGKTTQLPKMIFEAEINKTAKICITQPRRVAAVSTAHRVSKELNKDIGAVVGYNVRFDNTTTKETRIEYLTDGMLLREAMIDHHFMKYNVIILDEAHERTVHTDILFGIVKCAQQYRKQNNQEPLRIVIMSATMDVDRFSNYFGAPVVYLEGRQYPIEIMHTKQMQESYEFSCLVTFFKIHREAPLDHSVLIFLTGQDEIESMKRQILNILKEKPNELEPIKVYPLYAALPVHLQQEAVDRKPDKARKVVLATNIAETSLTIKNIKYVIDSGVVKARNYNVQNGLDILKVQKVSKEQAWQRTGRAGREFSGVCYRVYTEKEFEAMNASTVPEILRSNLSTVVLELTSIGQRNLKHFDFIDKPSADALDSVYSLLELMSAVKRTKSMKPDQEEYEVTEVGAKLAKFPLDPRFSKAILASTKYGCTNDLLSVISMICVDVIFNTAQNVPKERRQAIMDNFSSNEGDHVTLLKVFREFVKEGKNKTWCFNNCLNFANLTTALKIKQQLTDLCKRLGILGETASKNNFSYVDYKHLRQCLVTGFFMNAAQRNKDGSYETINGKSRQTVFIHPNSALHGSSPEFVIYTELQQTTKIYMKNLSIIDCKWLYSMSDEA